MTDYSNMHDFERPRRFHEYMYDPIMDENDPYEFMESSPPRQRNNSTRRRGSKRQQQPKHRRRSISRNSSFLSESRHSRHHHNEPSWTNTNIEDDDHVDDYDIWDQPSYQHHPLPSLPGHMAAAGMPPPHHHPDAFIDPYGPFDPEFEEEIMLPFPPPHLPIPLPHMHPLFHGPYPPPFMHGGMHPDDIYNEDMEEEEDEHEMINDFPIVPPGFLPPLPMLPARLNRSRSLPTRKRAGHLPPPPPPLPPHPPFLPPDDFLIEDDHYPDLSPPEHTRPVSILQRGSGSKRKSRLKKKSSQLRRANSLTSSPTKSRGGSILRRRPSQQRQAMSVPASPVELFSPTMGPAFFDPHEQHEEFHDAQTHQQSDNSDDNKESEEESDDDDEEEQEQERRRNSIRRRRSFMGQTPMPPSAMRRRSIQTFGPPPPPPPMPPMPQMGPHLPSGIGMAASGLGRRHSLYEPGPMSGEMMEHPMMRRMSIGGGMVPPPPPVPMGLNRPFGNSNMDLPLGNGDHSGTNSNNNSAPSTPWMPASYFSSPSGGGGGPPLSMNPQHQHQNPMTSMMTSSVSMGGMLPPPMGMPPPGMMMPPPSMGMGPAPPGMGFPGMGMMPPPPMGMMPPGMMNGMNNNGNGSANASMMGDDHHHDDMPNHQDQNDMRSGNGGNQGGGIMDGPPMSGGSGGGGSNGRGMDPSIGGMNGGMNGNNMGGGDMMNHHDDDTDQRHHGGGFGSGRGDDEMMHHGGGGPRGGGNFGNGGPGGPSSGMMMQGGGGGFGSPMMNGMPGGGRFGNGRQPQLGRSKSFFGSIFGNNGGSGNKNMMMDMNRWDRDSMVPLEDALQQMSIHKQGGGGGPAGMPGGGGLSRKSSRKLSTKAQQLQQFPGLWCYRPKNIMFQQQQQQHGEDEHGGGSNIWAPFSVANQHKLHRASEMNGGTTISLDKEEKLPGTVYVSPRTMLARHFRSTFGNPDILEIQYLPTQDTTFVVRPEFHPNEMGGYGGGSRRNPGPGSGGVTRLFSNVFGGGSQ